MLLAGVILGCSEVFDFLECVADTGKPYDLILRTLRNIFRFEEVYFNAFAL